MTFYDALKALSGLYYQAMDDANLFRQAYGNKELFDFLASVHFLGALCWVECRRRGLMVTQPEHVFGREAMPEELSGQDRLGIDQAGDLCWLLDHPAANDEGGDHD